MKLQLKCFDSLVMHTLKENRVKQITINNKSFDIIALNRTQSPTGLCHKTPDQNQNSFTVEKDPHRQDGFVFKQE